MSILNNSLLLGADAGAAGYQVSRSIRLNASDSAFLSRTPASAGNRKTWTWSGWVKRSGFGYFKGIFSAGSNNSVFMFNADVLQYYEYNGSAVTTYVDTVQLFRDSAAWYHILLAVDTTQATPSNRCKLYVNGVQVTALANAQYPAQGYDTYVNSAIQHYVGYAALSDRFFDGYLADIHFIDGQALTPSSFAETNATTGQWVPKAYTGSYGTNGFRLDFSDNSAATAAALGKDTSGNGNNFTPNNFIVSNAYTVLPTPSVAPTDPSGAWDGNPSTYAYGPSATTWTFSTPISLPAARFDLHARSGWTWTASTNLGTVTLTSNGTWPGSPGSYPGWYSYANAGLTTVYSISVSAGANWTLQGMQIAGNPSVVGTQLLAFGSQNSSDSLVDTPTSYGTDTGAGGEVRGNYCTWSPLLSNLGVGLATLSNGNLDATAPGQGTGAGATFELSNGKWYFETTITNLAGTGNVSFIGVVPIPYNPTYLRAYAHDGTYFNGSSWGAYGATFSTGDVVGCAVDLDANTIQFYKNGASQGQKTSIGLAGIRVSPFVYMWVAASTFSVNFGQRPFAYTAPSGFKALCDTNLPAPVVAKPSTVMDVKLYTGNGSTQTISGLGFSPDLVWIKSRSAAYNNRLYDQVRGVENVLNSNTTAAEGSDGTGLTAFTSSGFTLGSSLAQNENNSTFVAWTWDAGASTVTNTAGSINSQVRANASAGFSVITYTGNLSGAGVSTVGHGLGVAPSMVITKRRDGASNWCVQHISTSTASQILFLDTTDAQFNTSSNGTLSRPTSTVFSVNNSTGLGVNGQTHVAYCFAPVAGYSAFGSWTNVNSTDGVFVYTGMRPRFIILKNTDNVEQWFIFDSVRRSYNVQYPDPTELRPNSSGAEGSYNLSVTIDFLSNGFKIRGSTSSEISFGTRSYVYAAFAESPFQYARAR